MPVLQPIHTTGAHSITQARNLLASALPNAKQIKSVEDCTISISEYRGMINPDKSVAHYRASETGLICGNVVVLPSQLFYLIRSTVIVSRYYVVVYNQRIEQWQCSAEESRLAAQCFRKVAEYCALLKASGKEEEVEHAV